MVFHRRRVAIEQDNATRTTFLTPFARRPTHILMKRLISWKLHKVFLPWSQYYLQCQCQVVLHQSRLRFFLWTPLIGLHHVLCTFRTIGRGRRLCQGWSALGFSESSRLWSWDPYSWWWYGLGQPCRLFHCLATTRHCAINHPVGCTFCFTSAAIASGRRTSRNRTHGRSMCVVVTDIWAADAGFIHGCFCSPGKPQSHY